MKKLLFVLIPTMSLMLTACKKTADDTESDSDYDLTNTDSGDNSSGGSTTSSNPSEATLVKEKINTIEKQLAAYGVRFNTSSKTDYQNSNSSYERSILSVELQNESTDADLLRLNLKPSDRDDLLIKMSALLPEVRKANLNTSSDKDSRYAAMKVEIVRNKFMAPKTKEMAEKVTELKKDLEVLKFKKLKESGLVLLDSQSKNSLTNGELLALLEKSLALGQSFEAIKKDFVSEYIEQLNSVTSNTSSFDTDAQIRKAWLQIEVTLFESYQKLEIFSQAETPLVLSLVEQLKSLPAAERFDARTLDDVNQKFAVNTIKNLENEISNLVESGVKELGVTWINNSAGKPDFDQGSLSKARVQNANFRTIVKNRKNEIAPAYRRYNSAVQDLASVLTDVDVNLEVSYKVALFVAL